MSVCIVLILQLSIVLIVLCVVLYDSGVVAKPGPKEMEMEKRK